MILEKYIDEIEPGTACPVCDVNVRAVHYRISDEGKYSPVYRCQQCGFCYVRPITIPESGSSQMDTVIDAELFGNPVLRKLHKALILDREVRIARKYLGDGYVPLLDIGCGTGMTSSIWKEKGFDVTGLEPSSMRSAVAREKYGIKILPHFIEDIDVNEKFSLVVLRHVIEHLSDPFAVMSKVNSLVADDGLVLVIVPNIDCIGRYIFDTEWTWVLPWHCNFFNPASLRSLMSRAGFNIIKEYQTPSPLFYAESFLRRFPSPIFKKLDQTLGVLSSLAFSSLALMGQLLGHGDNITVIARKRCNWVR